MADYIMLSLVTFAIIVGPALAYLGCETVRMLDITRGTKESGIIRQAAAQRLVERRCRRDRQSGR